MLRRGVLALVAVTVALFGLPANAEAPPRLLQVSGLGGQTTTLDVGSQPLTLAAYIFRHPRLPGGDGTIGGVIVQRGSELVGGLVLINAPGFPYALTWELARPDLRLTKGRYRITLLGTVRQTVQLVITTGQASRQLSASGPARPVTRTFSGNGSGLVQWSDRLGVLRAGDMLLLGAGTSGTADVHARQTCLRRGDTASSGPCLELDPVWFNAQSREYSGTTQTFPEDQGAMTYGGQIETVGAGSSANHLAVVITPRR